MNFFCDCPPRISGWDVSLVPNAPESQPGWLRSLVGETLLYGGAGPNPFHPLVTHLIVEGETSGSQYDALASCSRSSGHIPGGTVMLALEGSGFHGQRGRPWKAHAGNIHLSACFHPDRDAEELGMGLTMVPAVAVLRTLRALHMDVPETGIKWVNDILIRGKKVAGVISSTVLQSGRVKTVIFGIGLNVETVPEVELSPMVPSPSCLNHCWDTAFTWSEAAKVLICSLAEEYQSLLEDGVQSIFQKYHRDSLVLGRKVRIYEDGSTEPSVLAQGSVAQLHPDLSLTLEERTDPVRQGRLVFEKGH